MAFARPVSVALLLSALVALAGCSTEAPEKTLDPSRDDPAARVPGAIVVDFKDGTTKAQFDALEKEWGVDLEFNSVEGQDDGITVAVNVPDVEGELAKIRQNPLVESAEPLERLGLPEGDTLDEQSEEDVPAPAKAEGFVPNDPQFARQWNLQQIHMPQAWQKSHGKGAVVAVLDTGIAYEDYEDFKQVPDLKGVKFVPGYDFVNKSTHPDDDHGHGTHVAGTIAQATNNKEGVAGVAFEASLMPVKVLNHFGSGTSADIADAIRWAADHGANVINMSLGGGGYSAVMANAVKYAHDKGVTVVCAAGNAGRGRVEYPAAYPGAIAVAAVGPDGHRAPYSSYGKDLDIAAPGGDKRAGEQNGILQNTIDPRDPSKSVYVYYQGTSMATPHVSGVAALLYAAGARSPKQVEEALYAGATQVNGQAWSEEYGHGLLDANKALASIGKGELGVDWHPLWLGAALLAAVLLTLGKKARPGYLNVLFNPGFLISIILSTVGAFFLKWLAQWIPGIGETTLDIASLPIPDWQDIIFGRGKLASPLFYSALIPIVLSIVGVKWKALRPTFGGLAIGFAAFLAYAAFAHAPALAWMPFTFLAIPWLVINALVCLFISRALLSREAAR